MNTKGEQNNNIDLQNQAEKEFKLEDVKNLLNKLENNTFNISEEDFFNLDGKQNLSNTEKQLYEKYKNTKDIISFIKAIISSLETKTYQKVGINPLKSATLKLDINDTSNTETIKQNEIIEKNINSILDENNITTYEQLLKNKIARRKILEINSDNLGFCPALGKLTRSNNKGLIIDLSTAKKDIAEIENEELSQRLKGILPDKDIKNLLSGDCKGEDLEEKLKKTGKLTKEEITDIVFGVANIKENKTKIELREILSGLGLNIKNIKGKTQKEIKEILENKGINKNTIELIFKKIKNIKNTKETISRIKETIKQNKEITDIYNNFISKYDELINSNITNEQKEEIKKFNNKINNLYNKISNQDNYSKDKLIIEIYKFNKYSSNITNKQEKNQKINKIIEKIQTKNINDMNRQELILALEYTNSYYNNKSDHFDIFHENFINELKDQKDFNIFQERLLKKLGFEKGYNDKFIVGYNNEKGNYIIKINDFKEKVTLIENIKNLNSKEIHNYFKKFSIENSNLKGDNFLSKLKKDIGISGYNKILTYIYKNQKTTDLKGIFKDKGINIEKFKYDTIKSKINNLIIINNEINNTKNNNVDYYINNINRIGEINNPKLIIQIINKYKGIINFSDLSNNLINNKEIINLIIKHNTTYNTTGIVALKKIDQKYYIDQKELLLFNYKSLDIKTIKNILNHTDNEGKETVLTSNIIDENIKEILLKQYPEIKKLLNSSVNNKNYTEYAKLLNNEKNINYELIDIFLSKQTNDIIYQMINGYLKEEPAEKSFNLLKKLPISRNKLFQNNDIAIKLININPKFFFFQEKKDQSNILRLKIIIQNIINENKEDKEDILGNILSRSNLDIYKNMEIFSILNNSLDPNQLKKLFFYPQMQAKFKSLVKNINKHKNIILTPDMNEFVNKIIGLATTYSEEFNEFNKKIEEKTKEIKKETSGNNKILKEILSDNDFMEKILKLYPDKMRNIIGLLNSTLDKNFGNPKYYTNELFRLYNKKDDVIKILNLIEEEINKKTGKLINEFNIKTLPLKERQFLTKKGLIINDKLNKHNLEKYHLEKIEILDTKFKQYNIKSTPEILDKIFLYEILNGKEINITSKEQLEQLIENSKNFNFNTNEKLLSSILISMGKSSSLKSISKTIKNTSDDDYKKLHNGEGLKKFWEKVDDNYVKDTKEYYEKKYNLKKKDKDTNTTKNKEKTDTTAIILKEYNFNSENGTVLLSENGQQKQIKLSSKEQKLVKENPEVIKNIVNFYDVLDKTGLSKLWTKKGNIFKAIQNITGIGFNIDGNYLDKNETKIFLNAILKSIGEKQISRVFTLENFITKIQTLNKNQTIGGGEAIVNTYFGETLIENKFFNKFVPRNGTIMGFKQSEFKKAIS